MGFVPAVGSAQSDGLLGGSVDQGVVSEEKLQADVGRLEKQLEGAPGNYRLWYELGNAYYDLADLQKAREAFEKSAGLNSKHVESMVNLGSVLIDLGELEDAVAQFENALAVDPEDCKARSNLGNAFYAQSKYPDAMFEYQRAIDIDPKCYSALFNIGVAFADAGLFREAVQWWGRVVEVAPGTDAARSAQENIKILERFTTAPIPER